MMSNGTTGSYSRRVLRHQYRLRSTRYVDRGGTVDDGVAYECRRGLGVHTTESGRLLSRARGVQSRGNGIVSRSWRLERTDGVRPC